MIQRIQSVFLLLAAIAAGVSALSACVEFFSASILLSAAALVALVTIFFYKKRKLQINFCIVDIILIVCYYIVFAYNFFFVNNKVAEFFGTLNYIFVAILPLISLIFIVLAIKHIKKDEKLVRSLDRIR
jgi:hypothetical protein